MKNIQFIIYLLALLCINNTYAQEVNQDYIKANYDKTELYITMRDGTKLFTSIYSPKDKSQKYPILLNRTPYTVAPYGSDQYKSYLGNFQDMAKQKYIYIYQDVRGKWMSEGIYENIRPTISPENKAKIDESTDTYDTIDWLVKNLENNNGNVGMYGISYPGFYSTVSLVNSHPALKAVSPQAPVTNWFVGDDFHHGGALFLMDAFRFMYSFDAPRPKPITNLQGPKGFNLDSKDYYKFLLEAGSLQSLKDTYLSHTVKFWDDLEKHQKLDTFWNNRFITNHLNDVKPAVMIVGGLYDAENAFGTFETYAQIEKRNKQNNSILVMGPWFHGGWVRSTGESFGDIKFNQKTSLEYQQNIELPFFDYYLKGKGKFDPAEATVFFSGSNQWKTFDQWPPKQLESKTLYFHQDHSLSSKAPIENNTYEEYISDPNKPVPFQDDIITERTREYMIADQRFVATRPDVIVFQTQELEEDITLAGPIQANLKVAMSGTDADFIVKVIDVYPDTTTISSAISDKKVMQGYQMLVRGEILRGRFREGFDKPKAFTPEQITDVNVKLVDVAHTFKKGHKIMVQIQHSWFPLVTRNPNQFIDIFHAKKEDYIKNTHKLYYDQNNPSAITFQVLKD